MKKLQCHYIKEFFKLLSIITLGLSLLFSILELIDKIDDFIPYRPSIFKLILYVLLNLPRYIFYLLPMALLISSLFIFSQASRNKELIAIKSAGGRLKALFSPFIVSGILLSVFAFIIGEIVVPEFTRRSREIRAPFKKATFTEGTLWVRGADGSSVRIGLYAPGGKIAEGISIFVPNGGLLKKRIEAEKAEWRDLQGIWRLKNITIYDIESEMVSNISEMDYPYLESPDFFSKSIKKPEEMSICELYRYTKRLNNAGFRDTKLIVDLLSKTSYPITNFFMIFLGICLALGRFVGSGLSAAGLGLFISLLYWLGHTLMLSAGYAAILPPFLSAWVMPFLLGVMTIYLFIKIPE